MQRTVFRRNEHDLGWLLSSPSNLRVSQNKSGCGYREIETTFYHPALYFERIIYWSCKTDICFIQLWLRNFIRHLYRWIYFYPNISLTPLYPVLRSICCEIRDADYSIFIFIYFIFSASEDLNLGDIIIT